MLFNKSGFSKGQFNRVSNIADGTGQVVLGVGALSPIISSSHEIIWPIVISAILVVIFCWLLSVWFAKKGD